MREINDRYYTPTELIKLLPAHLDINKNDLLFEPCVGIGQICSNIDNKWITNDIDCVKSDYSFDASDKKEWEQLPDIDWIITNPPFKLAPEILRNSLDKAKKGVAFLVRITFLEPTKNRQDILINNPPNKLLLMPRPKFLQPCGKVASDLATCVWIIWDKSNTNYIKAYPQFKEYTFNDFSNRV